jgi:hypothetical protein
MPWLLLHAAIPLDGSSSRGHIPTSSTSPSLLQDIVLCEIQTRSFWGHLSGCQKVAAVQNSRCVWGLHSSFVVAFIIETCNGLLQPTYCGWPHAPTDCSTHWPSQGLCCTAWQIGQSLATNLRAPGHPSYALYDAVRFELAAMRSLCLRLLAKQLHVLLGTVLRLQGRSQLQATPSSGACHA